MLRWLATASILGLLVLDFALPATPLGRRGNEAAARAEVPTGFARIGVPLPDLALLDLSGEPLDLADFRGHPLLVTFERSVDW
jgi:cytochrome oxidase Cu insertion factor (SCO1/SenC/PrrC family)